LREHRALLVAPVDDASGRRRLSARRARLSSALRRPRADR
jgi:hypothetical protein